MTHAQRALPRKSERHRFSTRSRQALFRRIANKLRAVPVSDHQTRMIWNNLRREVRINRKKKSITKVLIVFPLVIRTIIRKRRFDFDDSDITRL